MKQLGHKLAYGMPALACRGLACCITVPTPLLILFRMSLLSNQGTGKKEEKWSYQLVTNMALGYQLCVPQSNVYERGWTVRDDKTVHEVNGLLCHMLASRSLVPLPSSSSLDFAANMGPPPGTGTFLVGEGLRAHPVLLLCFRC